MIVTAAPIWLVDMIGAVLMILFSFQCLHYVRRLRQKNPEHLVWTYLVWVCYCLAGFAISRSAGHILKQILVISYRPEWWDLLRPFTGGINTFLLIIVASITLFFGRVWRVNSQVLKDKTALQKTHKEILNLNETLERRVEERTEALAQSEKQIAQADKLASIGQLSSGIAHEINNPLGIILGYTQLLLRNETDDPQKSEDLRTIEKHVKACKAIVEDLLNFARSSPPKRSLIDIHEVIDDVLNFLLHRSEMRVEKQYDDRIPKMLMDEKKMRQVLINLIMNAQHATEDRGRLDISTRFDPQAGQITIRMEDDGHGIKPGHLTRIFDPFFTTKPTGEGTGLGLAVSYGIVKSHGGDFFVESRPGEGAEFTLVLPVSGAKASDVGR